MTSTCILPVGPIGSETFVNCGPAVLNNRNTLYNCEWQLRTSLPCFMLDWSCADDNFVFGRNLWYPQAWIVCQNSSLKIVVVNLYGFNENQPLPAMWVRSIHWIIGTNICRVGSVIMRRYALRYTLPGRASPSLPLGLSYGVKFCCVNQQVYSRHNS